KVAGLLVDLRVQAGEDHISGHGKPPLSPFCWVDVAQSTPDFGWMVPPAKRLRHYYVSHRRPQARLGWMGAYPSHLGRILSSAPPPDRQKSGRNFQHIRRYRF